MEYSLNALLLIIILSILTVPSISVAKNYVSEWVSEDTDEDEDDEIEESYLDICRS